MLSEAKSFWDAIAGKVRELIRGETQNTFRMERYDVTTAPNGSRIGVTKPFGTNEIFLPYSAEVANATVGAPVLVTWWGSMSNAKVYYFADGYRGTTLPLAITQGGSGQTGLISVNVTTSVLTPASGITVTGIGYRQWGKVAMLRVALKSSSAISGVTLVATLVSGKRPPIECAAMVLDGNFSYGRIQLDGGLYVAGTAAADTVIVIESTYILA